MELDHHTRNRTALAGKEQVRRRSHHGRHHSVDLGSPTRQGLDWSFRNIQCTTVYKEDDLMWPQLLVPPVIDLDRVSRARDEREVDLKREHQLLQSPTNVNRFSLDDSLVSDVKNYGHEHEPEYVHAPYTDSGKHVFGTKLGNRFDDDTLWTRIDSDFVWKPNEATSSPDESTHAVENAADIAPYRFNV